MKPTLRLAGLGLAILVTTSDAEAGGPIAIQQDSARNYVSVIQGRNPFLTRSRSQTVTTGHTTVTEVVEIGPDPSSLGIRQMGLINRATVYQRGTQPSLDVRQAGPRNSLRSQQHSMP